MNTEQTTEPAPRRHIARVLPPWLIVVVLIGLGVSPLLPPDSLPADSPAADFSAERAVAHLDVLAREPHPMGSQAIAEVRAYLVEQLEDLGLAPEKQISSAPDYFGTGEPVEVVNLIGRLPGSSGEGTILLIAHYDTHPASPGANDNSAAVATLLETARALRAGPPMANDVVLLFTDGEEPAPRYGATSLLATARPTDPTVVVNFEALGSSGASVLVETNGPQAWIIGAFADAVPRPVAFSFLTDLVRLMGKLGTDFEPFRAAGFSGLHFAYLHGSPIYHTAADDIDAVHLGSVQHHGSYALGLARHLGEADLAAQPGKADMVFFAVRPFFIRYPAAVGIPLVLPAVAVPALAIRRRGGLGPSLRAARTTLAAVAIAITIGTVGWVLVTSVRTTPGIVESYLISGSLVWLGIVVGNRFARRRGRSSTLVGPVLVWVVLAAVTAVALPGMSYLFLGPALAGSIALAWRPPDHRWMRLLRLVVVAAPTLLVVTPIADLLFQLAQPRPGNPDSSIPAAVLLPMFLVCLSAQLVQGVWPAACERRRRELTGEPVRVP